MLLFALAGIDVDGGNTSSQNFGLDLNNSEGMPTITTSDFYKSLFAENIGILIIGLAVGIGIARLTNSPPENFIILPIISTHLVIFGKFLINLMQYMVTQSQSNPIISGITVLILAPLTIGYLISLIEFFRGSD